MPASADIYKTRAKMRQDVVYRIILSSLALTLQTGLKKVTQKKSASFENQITPIRKRMNRSTGSK